MARLALGFREHAGWAAAVVLEETETAPRVLDRLRIELCPPDLPREVHHAAAQLDPEGAKALVGAVTEAAAEATQAAVEDLLAKHAGSLRLAGVPVGERPVPSSPSATKNAHTMMHAAEGQLYREALAEGTVRAGLDVHRFSRGALVSLAVDASGRSSDQLKEALVAIGKPLGPPWAGDQKDAALCAWLALLKTA
jgi:hypothetical protein